MFRISFCKEKKNCLVDQIMIICLDISCITPRRTGIGQVAWEITRRLVKNKDHQFLLYFNSLRQPFPDAEEFHAGNVRIIRRKWPGPLFLFSQKYLKFPTIDRLLSCPFDCFVSFSNYIPPQKSGYSVSFIHDLNFLNGEPKDHDLLGGRYLRWVFKNRVPDLDMIFSISEMTTQAIRERGVTVPIVTTPLGVDDKFCYDLGVNVLRQTRQIYDLPNRYILTVGNRHPRKNLALMLAGIDYYNHLYDTKLVLVMVGPDKNWRSVEEMSLAAKLKKDNCLRELDYVPHDDMPALYRMATLYLLTATNEGFGLPVLESLACGTPVCCTDTVAALAYLENAAETVTTFPADATKETVSTAIRETLSKCDDAVNGSGKVVKQNSWDKTVTAMLHGFKQLNVKMLLMFCLLGLFNGASFGQTGHTQTLQELHVKEQQVVVLPYVVGTTFTVQQGMHGQYSHKDKWNCDALDFDMPLNTDVCAVYPGHVVLVETHYTEGGPDTTLLSKANRIVIDHGNNVFSKYLHLAPRSERVHVGDVVVPGQVIAKSGNIGYSSMPHLHFQLQDVNSVSLPAVFSNAGSETPCLLKEGQKYEALPYKQTHTETPKLTTLPPTLFASSGVLINEDCKLTLADFTHHAPIVIKGSVKNNDRFKKMIVVVFCDTETKTPLLTVVGDVDKDGYFAVTVPTQMLEKLRSKTNVCLWGMAVTDAVGRYTCKETVKIAL